LKKREKTDYIVQHVDIAFDILLLLAKKAPLKLKEIEEKLNVSSNQIEKILEILIERGYVDFNRRKKVYYLGIKNFEIGHSYLSHTEIRDIAKPYLQKLSETVNENIYLAIRSGFEIVYIDAYEVNRSVVVKSRVGRLLPMYASASGKVHLADMEPEELEEFFKEVKFVPYTENTITDKEKLIEQLQEVKKNGFAIDNEEWEKEVRCLSVPVRNYTGKVVAAVTLSFPAYRISFDKLLTEIKDLFIDTANQLSEKLGYSKELFLE